MNIIGGRSSKYLCYNYLIHIVEKFHNFSTVVSFILSCTVFYLRESCPSISNRYRILLAEIDFFRIY